MIAASFILLSLVMMISVYAGLSAAAKRAFTESARVAAFRLRMALLLSGWLVYSSVLSLSGVFLTAGFPPRVPLLLVMPLFVFIGWFFGSGRFRQVIAATPAHWVVSAQSFRIAVELLIFGLSARGMLPVEGTFEGYNYDVAIGLSAPLMGYLVWRNKLPAAAIILWNVLGLCTLAVVVFILISQAYFPAAWAHPMPGFIQYFGTFPYTLLAGLLMPLAVFMHVFSIVKTIHSRRHNSM